MVTGVSFEFNTCYDSITVRAHNEDVTNVDIMLVNLNYRIGVHINFAQ